MSQPNFTGLWRLNLDQSTFEIPRPDSSSFEIEHQEPRLQISVTHVFSGRPVSFRLELTTDGREYEHDFGELRTRTRASWDGEALVLDSKVNIGDDSADDSGTNLVRYSLKNAGRTFVAVERWRTTKHSHDNVWVFDRQ